MVFFSEPFVNVLHWHLFLVMSCSVPTNWPIIIMFSVLWFFIFIYLQVNTTDSTCHSFFHPKIYLLVLDVLYAIYTCVDVLDEALGRKPITVIAPAAFVVNGFCTSLGTLIPSGQGVGCKSIKSKFYLTRPLRLYEETVQILSANL